MENDKNPQPALTQRGLERRLKRHLKSDVASYAAITVPGFEQFTREEIERLQEGSVTAVERGIVEFCGPMELLYEAALHLRTANRLLFRISQFTARSYPELYNKILRINWELYCGFAGEVAVTVSSRTSRLHHTENIAATVFEALSHHQQQLMVPVKLVKKAAITIFIRFLDDTCTVSVDATGALLYKRGGRTATGRAPLRETTAAALLYASSWEKYSVIADPCCGTGSIVFEALGMSCGHAAGINRQHAFFSWPSFNSAVWERLKKKAMEVSGRGSHPLRLIAGDIDEPSINLLRKNLETSSDGYMPVPVEIICGSCLDFNSRGEHGSSGLIISNLPFGKRIGVDEGDIDTFYHRLGTWLKHYCMGWNYAFLVADRQFEKKAGITATTALSFDNGGIPVRLVTGSISQH